MGKFDGFLICSDIDGTFHCGDTIEKNSEAVRYFTQNGGRFTFCTGRSADYLRQPQFCSLINAPACLFNGSVVYDYRAETLLLEKRVPFTLEALFAQILPWRDRIELLYAYESAARDALILKKEDNLPEAVRDMHSLKIICTFSNAKEADAFRDFVRQLPLLQNCYISKSWAVGVEINAADGTKGHALDFIKAHLGNVHTAIGIGDYENDIPLLRHADMGVAVENALPEVKAAADLFVRDAKDCALVELIEMLDKKM